MSDIKSGVVVVTKFCRSGSSAFSSYINYIDRDEAVRTEHSSQYNLYQDYMGNPEKTTGLFTGKKDIKTKEDKEGLKDIFRTAQENGSLMWQTVISFDNRWLENNGLYNSKDGILDERRIKNITRSAVRKMLEKEGLEDAVWSAAIHYNTDNIHIHIATVEPEPVREKRQYIQYDYKEENGKTIKTPKLGADGKPVTKNEYKGTFRQGSIEACKREMVNQIINERENNLKINAIIRDSIVKQKREHPLAGDRDLAHQFLELYQHMPDCSRNMWNYNNPIMHPLKQEINDISESYLARYHKEEYRELKERMRIQEQKYRAAYGRTERSYAQTKTEDLFARLGNAILKEIRQYDREERDRKRESLDAGHTGIPEPEWKELEGDGQGLINDPWNGMHLHDSGIWDTERDIPDTGQTVNHRAGWEKTAGDNPGVINDPRNERTGRMAGYRTEWNKNYKEARKLIHKRPPDYARAVQILEREHSSGNILATCELGDVYQYGKGTPIDAARAESYYSQALERFQHLYGTTGGETGKWGHQYMAYRLGKMYYYGMGTETDYEKALNLFRESGSSHARYMLGKMAYSGQGMEQDYGRAYQNFLSIRSTNPYAAFQAASMLENNRVEDPGEQAQDLYESAIVSFLSMEEKDADDNLEYRIGCMYLRGQGTSVDKTKAEEYLSASAEAGNIHAGNRLAMLWLEEGRTDKIPEILNNLTEAAEKTGNKWSMYAMGNIYASEEYGMQDVSQALEWYSRAEGDGDEFISYRIGKLYMDRESGHFSVEKAVRHMEKAWANGNAMAAYQLGKLYMEKEYGIQDIQKAVRYLEQAAEQGNEYAAYRLGGLYRKEEYGMQDDRKAYYWYQQAEEKGNVHASYQLGKMDYEKKQYREAACHFARSDDMYAHYYLGKICLDKEGGMYDPQKGIEYMKQSAGEGNSFAELNLGWTFLKGEAVRRDRKEAEKWFRQSADHGNEQAAKILEELEKGKHYYAKHHIRKGVSLQKAVSRMKKGMKSEWERARMEREHARMVEQAIRE